MQPVLSRLFITVDDEIFPISQKTFESHLSWIMLFMSQRFFTQLYQYAIPQANEQTSVFSSAAACEDVTFTMRKENRRRLQECWTPVAFFVRAQNSSRHDLQVQHK